MNPSLLGDLGFQVAAIPGSTSTAAFFSRTSDTGTVLTTGRIVDLSRQLYLSTTGGKPLDSTVHPRQGGPRQFRSIAVALPLELVFHTSGLNTYITVDHKTRAAASGAGSTWETLESETQRFKMGTDTDATFQTGVVSSVNAQAIKRFYKANVTLKFRKASDTAAKDTSTNTEAYIERGPVYLLGGAAEFPAQGPGRG